MYMYVYVYIQWGFAPVPATLPNRVNGLCFCLPGSLDPGSLIPWFPGSLVPWFHGSLVPWFPGSLVPWFPGSLVPWFPSFLVPWFPGSLVPWFPSSPVPWFTLSPVPLFSGSHGSFPGLLLSWFSGHWSVKEIPKPIHSVGEANAIFSGSVFRWLSIGIVLTKIRANSIPNGTKNNGLRSFWDAWGSLFHVLGVPRGPREVPWVPGCSQDGFGQVLGGSWGSFWDHFLFIFL